MIIKHKCEFKSGTAIFENPRKFRDECLQLNAKKGYLTIHRERKQKSNQQNKYYWSVVIPILSDHLGYEKEEMHSALSYHFLRVKKKGLVFVRSTQLNDWKTAEWEAYMDKIKRWAADTFGVEILDPNQVDYSQITEYQ